MKRIFENVPKTPQLPYNRASGVAVNGRTSPEGTHADTQRLLSFEKIADGFRVMPETNSVYKRYRLSVPAV